LKRQPQTGFSIIELIVAMAVLLVVMGAIFQLLNQSQQRGASTAGIEDASSMLRDSVDTLLFEMRLAGYPGEKSYPCPPPVGAAYGACLTAANSGYVAAGFTTADPYALEFEGDTDANGNVDVIRYELQVPTGAATGGCAAVAENGDLTSPALMRSAVLKNADGTVPAPVYYPFLENVRNCELGVPIFVACPAPPAAAPAECPAMSNYAPSSLPAPRNTRMVLVRLQVRSAVQDSQTGQFLNVEQHGLAERLNPD
jgi:prepilin-type N-terminal cleavage/methylation domain-containing protein